MQISGSYQDLLCKDLGSGARERLTCLTNSTDKPYEHSSLKSTLAPALVETFSWQPWGWISFIPIIFGHCQKCESLPTPHSIYSLYIILLQ